MIVSYAGTSQTFPSNISHTVSVVLPMNNYIDLAILLVTVNHVRQLYPELPSDANDKHGTPWQATADFKRDVKSSKSALTYLVEWFKDKGETHKKMLRAAEDILRTERNALRTRLQEEIDTPKDKGAHDIQIQCICGLLHVID